MFGALALGVFFALWVWVVRRNRIADARTRRLLMELADKQRESEGAEHRVRQILGFLDALHERHVSPSIRAGRRNRQASWQDLADFIVQSAGPLIGMDAVVLLQWDSRNSEYRGVAGRGISPQHLSELRVRSGEGVLGQAAQNGKLLVAQEASPGLALSSKNSFLSIPYLICPLWVQFQPRGLLVLCRPRHRPISQEAIRLATLMAKHIEMTMENLELYESRQRVYAEVVGTLSQAASAKETVPRGHAEHCRDLVRAMAQEMRLPELLAEQMEFGAMLHDIGKLGISEVLLSRPGPLTPEEYADVKKHPGIGYRLVRDIDFLKAVAPIVLYHHEWFNGQGYPEGLAGEEIPLGARMVALANAWDAMTTDQPYRKALPKNMAIAELRQQAGAQFDPKLVDIFVHVIEGKRADATPHPHPLPQGERG